MIENGMFKYSKILKNNYMKELNISKREIVFFFLGVLAMIIVDTALNWEDCKKSFMDGWNGYKTEAKN